MPVTVVSNAVLSANTGVTPLTVMLLSAHSFVCISFVPFVTVPLNVTLKFAASVSVFVALATLTVGAVGCVVSVSFHFALSVMFAVTAVSKSHSVSPVALFATLNQ
ncbi:hypothetical protein R84B8_01478 [Treponema sp. R8-4-B8]